MNELFLYDEIGPARWGLIDAKMVIDALADFGSDADVVVRFNSPGGSVFEAQAIAAAFQRHQGQTTGVVDGVAASAASYIFQVMDRREMNEGTHQMVHGPWTFAMGNKKVLRDVADRLELFEASIREVYDRHWTGSAERLDEVLLSEETWFTAAEAVDAGLADEVLDAPAIAACIPDGLFKFAPPSVAAVAHGGGRRRDLAARRLAGDVAARREWLDIRTGQLGLTPAKREK